MSESSEAAANRRRWITIGETIGILALGISAAGLYLSYEQRSDDKAGAAAQAIVRRAPLVLTATASAGGDTLRLAPAEHGEVIQTQTVSFPAALGVAPVDTTGNARIEADWFAAALRAAIEDAGAKPPRRLPVGIVTRYTIDGAMAEDRAVYEIGFATHARLLQPDAVTLEGLTLAGRASGDLQTAIDARWQVARPKS